MKIRLGFVSNSSSSSYICDVCGISETTYNDDLEAIDMYRCVHGHVFHGSCWRMDIPEEVDQELNNYQVPEKYCPICTMTAIRERDALDYLLCVTFTTMKSVEATMRGRFKNHAAFTRWLEECRKHEKI